MVVVGTQIHVEVVGFAHESGTTETDLLEWFHLTKEQLYGALAYFYGNRESLINEETDVADLAQILAQKGTEQLRLWRKKQSES